MPELTWKSWKNKGPIAQTALDAALAGLLNDPQAVGYAWAWCAQGADACPPDIEWVLGGDWIALANTGGNLASLWTGLIPEGGVLCPAGSFVMGSPSEEKGRSSEETQHRVTLTRGFALGKYPVTQRLYLAVMGKNPSVSQNCANAMDLPVELVDWYNAVRFCNALSQKLGLEEVYEIVGRGKSPEVKWDPRRNGYRLPTEAEWEYAARSGGDPFRYAGSDDLSEVGWFNENSGDAIQPVGQKKPNRWGLYDMSGNVNEWLQDWKGNYSGDGEDCFGPQYGSYRGFRGGNWAYLSVFARVANRNGAAPSTRNAVLGFRIARTTY